MNMIKLMTPNFIVETNPYDAIAKIRHQWKSFKLYSGSDRDYEPLFKQLGVEVEIIKLNRSFQ